MLKFDLGNELLHEGTALWSQWVDDALLSRINKRCASPSLLTSLFDFSPFRFFRCNLSEGRFSHRAVHESITIPEEEELTRFFLLRTLQFGKCLFPSHTCNCQLVFHHTKNRRQPVATFLREAFYLANFEEDIPFCFYFRMVSKVKHFSVGSEDWSELERKIFGRGELLDLPVLRCRGRVDRSIIVFYGRSTHLSKISSFYCFCTNHPWAIPN